ncbi:transketolase family protein [Nocardioides cynanchi]|uniref:transketolase family protein n=1 Tax=Nocardioides cynanchi TaxID=2558918 RepID=UPI0012456998|nr:transketolase [Nocardioides cynanchi]
MTTPTRDPRTQFARTATDLLDEDLSTALVIAEISARFFGTAFRRHPDRALNVGIREQLLVNVGAGMALTGMRPIVHTFGTFLVERTFEQVKLGFGHQGVGGVLVGVGGSFDASTAGRTHQAPGDVALMDTLPDVAIHAPGTAAETDAALRSAVAAEGLHYVRVVGQTNADSFVGPGLHVVRRGAGATVIAFGPVLDEVLTATAERDVTVLYTHTVRPFDGPALRRLLGTPEVVLVEPWLAGTSARCVADALVDVPHRLLALGTRRAELRHYGSPAEHQRAHGLDAAGIRRSVDAFLAA